MARKKKDTYSQRDIASVLNNAVLRALKPTRLTEIPDDRLQKLYDYALALLEPTYEHVEENLLEPEELVVVLTAAALVVQTRHVMGMEKLPMSGKAKLVIGDGDNEID